MKAKFKFLLIYFTLLTTAHLLTLMVIRGRLIGSNDLLGAVAFGLILAFIFTELQSYFWQKKMENKFVEDENGIAHQTKVSVKGEPKNILQKLKRALSKKKWQLVSEDIQRGELEFRTGVTWKSWGEVIYVQAWQRSDDEVDVDIYSQPSWRKSSVDFGKNEENIREVERILKKI